MSTMKVMLGLALMAASAIYISAGMGISSNCCTKVSERMRKPTKLQIEDFYIQNASLPCVDAILFVTNTKIIICAHPNTPWVKKKVEELRKKKEGNKKIE